MNQKPILKIATADFWDDVTQNELDFFLSPLRDKYTLVVDDKAPDLLIYSCFGDKHLQYLNCKRLFICGENVVPDFNCCDYSISTLKVQFENRNFWLPWGLFHNCLSPSVSSHSVWSDSARCDVHKRKLDNIRNSFFRKCLRVIRKLSN